MWVWAARQDPVEIRLIRFLAVVMFVGGLGRLASMVVLEVPHPFFIGLTALELVLPPLVLASAAAFERVTRPTP